MTLPQPHDNIPFFEVLHSWNCRRNTHFMEGQGHIALARLSIPNMSELVPAIPLG